MSKTKADVVASLNNLAGVITGQTTVIQNLTTAVSQANSSADLSDLSAAVDAVVASVQSNNAALTALLASLAPAAEPGPTDPPTGV